MPDTAAFRFVDLDSKSLSRDIAFVFPDWTPGDERVVILSPHDDDAVLGAGHAILAVQAFGGEAHVLIYCDGSVGYSTPEEKDTIVAARREEAIAAYGSLGIAREAIHRLWIDDLAAYQHLGWNLPDGEPGTCWQTVALLRKIRATRVLVPNGYRENVDHEAVCKTGIWDAPLVGDPIAAEMGLAEPVRSAMQYSVWGDYSPEDALTQGRDLSLRANTLILCERDTAAVLNEAIAQWRSQEKIIEGLVQQREARRFGRYMIETYIRLDPRPTLDYAPYAAFLESTFGGEI